MPTRKTAPAGAPCWIDLMTSDTDRVREFYGRVFGWDATDPDPEFGGYLTFTLKDGTEVAGCMPGAPGTPLIDRWSVYLASSNAEKTTQAASAAGGQVVMPVMKVGDLGTFSIVADPDGAAISIWEPGKHPGFTVYQETGTPGWFELQTRNFDTELRFYQDVFGWQTRKMSESPALAVQQSGEEMLAGIIDASDHLPDDAPASWAIYFAVDDTNASLETIKASGGRVIQEAYDTPYGRLAAAADPAGAQFKLVSPNEDMPARDA